MQYLQNREAYKQRGKEGRKEEENYKRKEERITKTNMETQYRQNVGSLHDVCGNVFKQTLVFFSKLSDSLALAIFLPPL